MNTVSRTTQTSFREKGSKFIGYLFPIHSVEEFEELLAKIISEHSTATHHCYGWRVDPNKVKEFSQDDGEPSGTAGLPILNRLKSYEAVNCGCVVVRYYGGTKLGKSGLIQAYGHSTELCIRKATLLKLIATQNFSICYPYRCQKHIDKLKNNFDLKEIDSQYREHVTLKIACRSEQAEAFCSSLKKFEHEGITVESLGPGFITT